MQVAGFAGSSLSESTMAQKNAAIADDFLSFMKEMPAQRLQDQWMKSHGITKDKLASMSADERAAVMKQMQDEISEKIKQQATDKQSVASSAASSPDAALHAGITSSSVRSITLDTPGITVASSASITALASILAGSSGPAPNAADNADANIYATIQKGGATLATFHKGGLMMTPNSVQLPSDLENDGQGTALADARIKQMLAAVGGEVAYR